MMRHYARYFGSILISVAPLASCSSDGGTSSSSGVGANTSLGNQTGSNLGLGGASTASSRNNVGGAIDQTSRGLGGTSLNTADASTAPGGATTLGGAVGIGSANASGSVSATSNTIANATGGKRPTDGSSATGSAKAAGGTHASGGSSAKGGTAEGGSIAKGGTSAKGGTTATAGANSAKGGTSTKGTSTTAAGGGSATGGASSSGSGGKACHSTADWTPKSDDLWISPSGNDANDGTEASPKKTLTAAVSKWSSGKTIWVSPGTYALGATITLSTKATSSGPLLISGVKGSARPIFDFSSEPRASDNNGIRGLQLSGSYVHLRYLEFKKAADNCLYVTGSNNTLEWLTVHECQDTGVQLSNGAASNRILNVDSYLNADPTGENADGFAPKLDIGQNNYFCGTRSYQNADDGYDCWAAGDNSPVTFEYCWAFGQPGPTATSSSDGNGFKLGSPADRAAGGNAPHKLVNCFAFNNRASGFTGNGNSSGQITCTNCGAWGNGVAYSAGTGGKVPQHTGDVTGLNVSTEKAMNAARDANGNLPDITKL